MYMPLHLQQLDAGREIELARKAEQARRLKPEPGEPGSRRSWWPRPRRSGLRLAFVGAGTGTGPQARSSKACADC